MRPIQRLKKAWNFWMDLDAGIWFQYVPAPILILLVGAGYLFLTVGMFWYSYECFDLRHPMYGKNHYIMGEWERRLFGCGGVAACVFLVVYGIGQIREMWWCPAVDTPAASVKKLYRRGKNRFKPTNRRKRQ